MAKQTINIGTVANDGTGDTIRDAFDKANDNFTETYDNAAAAQAAADDAQADATQAISDAAAAQTDANTANAALATKADLVAGKVPASQLPAYVDDVLEFANLAAFPVTGEADKIYIAIDTNLTYRWSGSAYVNLDTSLALGETSSTAYRGDRGKTAYDHSQDTTTNPHNVTKTQVGLSNVPNLSFSGSNTGDQDLSSYATTAAVNALDANNVKLTGNQSIAGTKTFTTRVVVNDYVIISTTGNSYAVDISNTETGPALYTRKVFAVGSTNEHGIICRDLFDSATFAYAAYDAQSQMAASKTYNHYAGFQQRGELLGSANCTNYYSIYSAPTTAATSTIGTLYHFRANSALVNASTTVTVSYAFIAETMKGTTKWAFYSQTDPSYFAGNVNIGTTPSLNSRNLNIYAAVPSFGMGISTERMLMGIASATNVGITGSATGDFYIRAGTQKLMFSGDDGTTGHFTISAAGKIGISQTTPTAWLHLRAGSATADTAPIKFTSGTLNTSAVAGQMEYNNTFHLTNSDGTRRNIMTAVNATKTTAGAPYLNDGYITINIGGTDVRVMTTA